MKIQFCDLCNESVPEADFAKGKAVMRQGRVVCQACDSSMSHHKSPLESHDATRLSAGVGPGPLAPAAAAPAPVHHRPAKLRMPRPTSAGAWIGLLALAFVSGSSWFFWNELTVQRHQAHVATSNTSRAMGRLEGNLDRFSLGAQRRADDLEARLQSRWNRENKRLQEQMEGLDKNLLATKQRLAAIDAGLILIAENLRVGEVDSGRRMDDLLAQSMKSRVELDELSTRIERTESNLAGRPAAPVLVVEPPKVVAYSNEIADLGSDVAGTRWNAVSALGETGDPAVVPHLIPILKDSDVFVRMAVARVFGDLGSPLAIESLIEALEDEEPIVREAAMAALHILTGRDFRFDPHAKSGERIKRVNAWRQWWKKARADFLGDA